ncbi:hypothetical protein GGR42_000687 [Saonia flava]|uniref:Putative auto-transporter adhesin head GIN domain-containing protein n=1 Tax=Saonia flava TaxID=523696 RepID=A0A846QX72_9FLAO|nr:DUF2807 domain-containing protein [Saonia flava]NJB70225.1 hypothetical protein [Saonia flava]
MKKLGLVILLLSISNYSIAQYKDDIIETIKVGGVTEVYFTHEPSKEKIQKIVSGKPAPEIIINYKDGLLEIDTKGEAQKEVVKVYVSSLNLKDIIVDDAAQFHSVNIIKVKSLSITVNDYAAADIMVDIEDLNIKMDGGDLDVYGQSKNLFILKGNDHERGTLNISELESNKL